MRRRFGHTAIGDIGAGCGLTIQSSGTRFAGPLISDVKPHRIKVRKSCRYGALCTDCRAIGKHARKALQVQHRKLACDLTSNAFRGGFGALDAIGCDVAWDTRQLSLSWPAGV